MLALSGWFYYLIWLENLTINIGTLIIAFLMLLKRKLIENPFLMVNNIILFLNIYLLLFAILLSFIMELSFIFIS